jgi:hypothetical protein
MRIGTGAWRTTVAATAAPSPPSVTASSAVTIAPVSRAAAMIAASSSGLIVETLITRASIPFSARASAASSARLTRMPVATIVRDEPWRRTFTCPNANAFDSSGLTEGAFVRPILR